MLRAPHLRSAFADLLTGTPDVDRADAYEPFISGGVAERLGDGIRLKPDVVPAALAALDVQLSPLGVIAGARIALSEVAPSAVDATVAAVAHRVVRDGERVSERVLNDRLGLFVDDVAFFRRHAVDTGVLDRERDGASYWRAGDDITD